MLCDGSFAIAGNLNECIAVGDSREDLGVAGTVLLSVAGLLVAIPSMFGYNWLVHNLRVFTVGLDNFAQELVSKMETEFLADE